MENITKELKDAEIQLNYDYQNLMQVENKLKEQKEQKATLEREKETLAKSIEYYKTVLKDIWLKKRQVKTKLDKIEMSYDKINLQIAYLKNEINETAVLKKNTDIYKESPSVNFKELNETLEELEKSVEANKILIIKKLNDFKKYPTNQK